MGEKRKKGVESAGEKFAFYSVVTGSVGPRLLRPSERNNANSANIHDTRGKRLIMP